MDYIDPAMSIDYPPGWVDLPTDPKVGTRRWFDAFIRADSATEASARNVRVIAEGLAKIVKDYSSDTPDVLIAYWPELSNPPLAVCEITGYPLGADSSPDLEDAVKGWGRRRPETVGEISVELRTLPAGPAARMRRMAVDKGRFGKGMVGEWVSWAVRPPGLNGTIFIIVSWLASAMGDTLAEQADLIANGLTIIENPENPENT